ncbi:hypothetical protein KC19_3G233400 [Ceratodon purpureus]|uniref:Uncharacterized protein n=1 Tax=Ceratodon purpureus TaxID=3225 RepID=A0A8T0IP38_CERPU|nr:hypothetical protein KC19_3G233400 [Ceratodon purpureus]
MTSSLDTIQLPAMRFLRLCNGFRQVQLPLCSLLQMSTHICMLAKLITHYLDPRSDQASLSSERSKLAQCNTVPAVTRLYRQELSAGCAPQEEIRDPMHSRLQAAR